MKNINKIWPYILPFITVFIFVIIVVSAFLQKTDHSETKLSPPEVIYVDDKNAYVNQKEERLFSAPEDNICLPEIDAGAD